MQAKVNINIAVDTIGALSDRTLLNHIYMMDNSDLPSAEQGTSDLSTCCRPGQIITWVIYAIDLQTSVSIKNITFIDNDNKVKADGKNEDSQIGNDDPDSKLWSGIVPFAMRSGLKYRYRLEIQMGSGPNSILFIDTPSLVSI